MAKIFISHSYQDKELIGKITKALAGLGHEILMDETVLGPGMGMRLALQEAIRNANYFIVVLTNNSLTSKNVMSEIGYAQAVAAEKRYDNFLIPLIYNQTNVPDLVRDIYCIPFSDESIAEMINRVHGFISETKDDSRGFETLAVGSKSDEVSSVQRLLKEQGFYPGETDGVFGQATVYAVMNFQKSINLPVDGIVDSLTYDQLVSLNRKKVETSSAQVNSYWFIKFNYRLWGPGSIKPGSQCYYNTFTQEQKPRPEYDEFQEVREGDMMLGYDFAGQNVVCVLRVTARAHTHKRRGEIISLEVQSIIENPIALNYFKDVVDFSKDLSRDSALRLFSIKKKVYDAILGMEIRPQIQGSSKLAKIFFKRSRFAIGDSVEPVLGVRSVAVEIADLIRNLKTRDVGKMFGIFGNWGRGKTFLAERVWEELQKDKEQSGSFIRVNFHAWKFQDTNASWAYLYEAFAKKYFENSGGPLNRLWIDTGKRLDLNATRHGVWPFIRFLLTLAFVAASVIFAIRYKENLLFILTAAGVIDTIRLSKRYFEKYKVSEKASDVFRKYFSKPSFKDLLGIQAEIQGELRSLLECWIKLNDIGDPVKRIILFIDDIDRCSEDRIIQLIDSLRVMLEDEEISKRVTVIAAVDERMLKRAIKWKYHALLDADRELRRNSAKWNETTLQISSEYMDKLFLSGIKLGTLTAAERVEVYKQFSNGKVSKTSEQLLNETVLEANDKERLLQGGSEGQNKPLETDQPSEIINLFKGAVNPNERSGGPRVRNTETIIANKTVPESSFELTPEEDDYLRKLIEILHEATPRQIRIYYYRYMLARNLLTSSLSETNRDDVFPVQDRNQLLAELLIHYCSYRSNNELHDDRRYLLSGRNLEQVTVSKIILGRPDALIYEVMDVLEMVVAY